MSDEKIESEEIVEKDITEAVENVEKEATKVADDAPKRGKHKIAKYKIEQAKKLSQETKKQIEECMKNIDLDIEEFNAKKAEFFAEALLPSDKLLDSIGVEETILEELPSSKVELLDPNKDSVEIQDISSGRFKGLFFSLVAGGAAVAGWCYMATAKLGLAFVPEKIPDMERLNKVLEWTSEQIGQGTNANIGAGVVIGSALLIMWIVYSIIVSSRAGKNLKKAVETEESVGAYCTSKEECKIQMQGVREHIQNSTRTVEKFKVLLLEQNAKLNRALFVEEVNTYDDLHANTRAEIQTTQYLASKVKKLMDAPIAESGTLTDLSVMRLKDANKAVNDQIMKIYA